MGDQFQKPQDQAQLDALRSQLSATDAGIISAIDAMGSRLAEAQRSETARARSTSYETRSTASALPELREEVEAVNQQVVSYERLNELIAERIKLEAQAASAIGESAATSQRAARSSGASVVPVSAGQARSEGTSLDVWLAEQRALRDTAAKQSAAEEQRMGQRQRWTTTDPEAQRTAAAVQSVQAAPATAAAEAEQAMAEAEERAATAARAEIEALAQLAAQQRAATTAAEEFAAAQGESREAMLRSAMAMAELDNSMGQSGALSTAAIQAMANGTITVRELGNQVAETVGKFGLWAGAAAAVYGVLGALDEVKDGAVDVSSSVTALGRFLPAGQYNPSAARQSIIQQGQETATPLDQVGDTAQQFSKVLKNQGDVFTATHVALTAAKLDNITLANSYSYLTAIMQESGVSASKLPGIFDQITAAQDKVGARVSVMLPAVAGSIGAVQSAGGNTSQLIGLEALTSIRTGFQGATIANMFRQGAGNYYNQASERGVRSRFGIDPNEGFTQALIQALEKSPALTGVERQTLAGGFFGSRYGPRAAPLFRASPSELHEALDQTATGTHPGLANKQLGNAMSQTNNQLAMLKVNLQAIGAELTGSNMTSPFGALLTVVNLVLKASGELVQVWDSLPGPVKDVGSDMAALAATVAIGRRFNLGGIMANSDSKSVQMLGMPFRKNPSKILSERVDAGMGTVSSEISSRLAQAQTQQMRSSMDLTAAQSRMAAADQSTEAGLAEYKAALLRAEAATDALAEAQASAARYVEMGSAENQALMRTQMTAIAGGGAATRAVGASGVPVVVSAAASGGVEEGAITARMRAFSATMTETAAAEEVALGGTTVLTAGMVRLSGAATATSSALASLAGKAIPGAIAALVALDAIKGSITGTQKAQDEGITRISGATTPGGVQAGVKQYVDSDTLHIPVLGNVSLPFLGGDAHRHALADEMSREQMGQLHARQQALQSSSNLLQNQVNPDLRAHNYEGAYKAFGEDKALQFVHPEQYANISAKLYKQSEGQDVTGNNSAQNPFAEWEQASQSLQNMLEPMMEATANSAKVFGTSGGTLSNLAAGYAYSVEKFGNNPQDTQAMQALAQAQTDLVGAVSKQVQDLTNLAEMATTNSGQASDYQQALNAVSGAQQTIRSHTAQAMKLPGANHGKLQDSEREALGLVAQNRQTAIQGLLGLYSSETDVAVSQVGGVGPAADLKRAEAQLQGYSSQLSSARSMGADASTVNELLSKVNQQALTVLQDKVSYYQQLSQAVTTYQQGSTANPIQQQQIAISQLGSLYNQLVSSGDHDQTELLAVLGQKRAAVMQQVADQISQEQAQSQAGLSKADIGQPQQVQLGKAVGAAQQQLSYLLSLPTNEVNPTTLISAYNNLYQAQGALAQFVIQQGEAMISAEASLKAGQTFDPVAIANAALVGAKQLLAYDTAHNMPAATLKSDAAGVASDVKSQMEAAWQRSEATTEYLASTYQITGATEIQRLQSLMVTMKKAHASYQDVQQVAQELFNLEYGSTGNLNLNTGSIHLPSTYEVKSAIMGGKLANRRKTAAGMLAEVQTNVHMVINVSRDADMHKVANGLSKALGTSVNGLAQAAGLV